MLNAAFWFRRKVGNPATVPKKALLCQNPAKHCEIKSKKDTAEAFVKFEIRGAAFDR